MLNLVGRSFRSHHVHFNYYNYYFYDTRTVLLMKQVMM